MQYWGMTLNRWNLKTPRLFSIVWEGEHALYKRSSFETDGVEMLNHVTCLPGLFSKKKKSKMTGGCCVFLFLRRSVSSISSRFGSAAVYPPPNWWCAARNAGSQNGWKSSLGVVRTQNIWCVFRVKPQFSNFSDASSDRLLLTRWCEGRFGGLNKLTISDF